MSIAPLRTCDGLTREGGEADRCPAGSAVHPAVTAIPANAIRNTRRMAQILPPTLTRDEQKSPTSTSESAIFLGNRSGTLLASRWARLRILGRLQVHLEFLVDSGAMGLM